MTTTRYVVCRSSDWNSPRAYESAIPLTGVRHLTVKSAAKLMEKAECAFLRDGGRPWAYDLMVCASDAVGDYRPLDEAGRAICEEVFQDGWC